MFLIVFYLLAQLDGHLYHASSLTCSRWPVSLIIRVICLYVQVVSLSVWSCCVQKHTVKFIKDIIDGITLLLDL